MGLRYLILAFVAAVVPQLVNAQWNTTPPDAVEPDWRQSAPGVVFPDSSLVELYNRAWATASGRVRRGPEGMVASPYLDENCYDDQIWIWDGCFMVMFSKYAPDAFPGKETLMNYYAPIHDGAPSPLRIHLIDNPPLFAWTELENFRFSADTTRLAMLLGPHGYLERHYHFFNNLKTGDRNPQLTPNPVFIRVCRNDKDEPIGYICTGNSSGMDNTPRGRESGGWGSIMWVDAIGQQALAAKSISELNKLNGDTIAAARWMEEFERLKTEINNRYWDDEAGFYFDVDISTGKPCRVMTVASYWPMLAGVASPEQAERMVEKLRDPDIFGGELPWNSLSRADADYDSVSGNYWRGGIWIPMVYMGTKALERYGYTALADSLAEKVVRMQARVYKSEEPHTIWETYNPNFDGPSTEHGRRVRQEFCGWSALGPISLFIENIMGFRRADGLKRELQWDIKPQNGRHGLRHFRFGDIVTDLIYDPLTSTIRTKSNCRYILLTPDRRIEVPAGESTISL